MSTIYQEFTYGDIVSLRGNSNLIVTSPCRIVTLFPASIHRVQRFRVEELGTWLYEWGDGMKGEFLVVPILVPEILESSVSINKVPESEVQIRSQPPLQSASEKFLSLL